MTTDIRFTPDSFSFVHNGQTFCVHTEVGDGPARVVVDESVQAEQPMEPEEQ